MDIVNRKRCRSRLYCCVWIGFPEGRRRSGGPPYPGQLGCKTIPCFYSADNLTATSCLKWRLHHGLCCCSLQILAEHLLSCCCWSVLRALLKTKCLININCNTETYLVLRYLIHVFIFYAIFWLGLSWYQIFIAQYCGQKNSQQQYHNIYMGIYECLALVCHLLLHKVVAAT